MITPVGRLSYVTLIKPRAVQQQGRVSDPKFSVTILLNPAVCQDVYRAIAMVASARWPGEQRPNPQNPSEMIVMTGEQLLFLPQQQGGLHYPLRDGNDAYMREPAKYAAFRGMFSINASTDAVNRTTGASMQPVALAEDGTKCDIAKFYSGCYGRLQVTFFPFPKQGVQIPNRGVGVALNAVQFAHHGEKLATFDAEKAATSAFAAVGALPTAPLPTGGFQTGFGPHTGGPGSVPPGTMVPGFAAPPAQQVQQPQQQPQPQSQPQPQPTGQPIPPQQPWQPQQQVMPQGGARPPGV
jgi:hypothetical protein